MFSLLQTKKAYDCGDVLFTSSVLEINENGTRASVPVGRVWCRSYATYDADDGVSVYVKLYVPWYYLFANPKFTSMSGVVTVTLNSQNTAKAFYETEDESKTIETTVDTGATAASGTQGSVVVTIYATGTNIEAGTGLWTTSYEITIP